MSSPLYCVCWLDGTGLHTPMSAAILGSLPLVSSLVYNSLSRDPLVLTAYVINMEHNDDLYILYIACERANEYGGSQLEIDGVRRYLNMPREVIS